MDPYESRPPSFGLGNYWIVSSYLTATFLIPLSLIISIMAEGTAGTSLAHGSLFVGIICLLVGILMVGSAWGLQNRQVIGLYFTYAFLATQFILALALILHTLLSLSENEIPAFAYLKFGTGGVFVLLSVFWWFYFNSRSELLE